MPTRQDGVENRERVYLQNQFLFSHVLWSHAICLHLLDCRKIIVCLLSTAKITTKSSCIYLGHTGPDSVKVKIISYNIYQTLKLLGTHVVLTLASLDRMT